MQKLGKPEGEKKGHTIKSGIKSMGKNYQLYLLLLPGLLWFLAFAYRPMAGLRIAFYDYNIFRGFDGSTFVGMKNFVDFLTGRDFLRGFKNTLMISFWQSTRYTAKALTVSLSRSVICLPILVLILPRTLGGNAVWLCHSLSEAVTACLAFGLLVKKQKSVARR